MPAMRVLTTRANGFAAPYVLDACGPGSCPWSNALAVSDSRRVEKYGRIDDAVILDVVDTARATFKEASALEAEIAVTEI